MEIKSHPLYYSMDMTTDISHNQSLQIRTSLHILRSDYDQHWSLTGLKL